MIVKSIVESLLRLWFAGLIDVLGHWGGSKILNLIKEMGFVERVEY